MNDFERPRTRGDCKDGPRPCPWVSCRHHLWLNLSSKGKLTGIALADDLPTHGESCALDVAESGPQSLEDIAGMMGIKRQGLHLTEVAVMEKLREHVGALGAAKDSGLFESKGAKAKKRHTEMSDYRFSQLVDKAFRRIVPKRTTAKGFYFGALTRALASKSTIIARERLLSVKTGRVRRLARQAHPKCDWTHLAVVITGALTEQGKTKGELAEMISKKYCTNKHKSNHILSQIYAGIAAPLWARRVLDLLGVEAER